LDNPKVGKWRTVVATKLSGDEFLRNLIDSTLFPREEIATVLEPLRHSSLDGEAIAERLVAAGKLTRYQADALREQRFEELVIGNYQVLDRLGAGAMGTVYKARHKRMKRVVAIKVLSREVCQSEKLVRRFQREVEVVARLNHPNIVMAHDADEAEVGHFLVMEFVDGRDLASEVQKRGPLPIREAVNCIVQAARALDYAHGQGIVHRDIKPANLLRDVHGVVKVADLGLARFNDPFGRPTEEMAALTQAGSIMGTVDYMPPEQALGLTNIDHRADIYSLGCTLYYLLIGSPPFLGNSLMAILLKHREAPPPSLCAARNEIPAGVDSIFIRMVEKKPENRFTSMAEVAQALESLPLGTETQAKRSAPSVTPREAPSVRQETEASELTNQTVDLVPAAPARSSVSALLVEPSRSQAVIIRTYLQGLGYSEITILPSGQKALEAAGDAPPSVVVSAMHLKDMTGLELARRMRAERSLSAVGFVLISSESDAQELGSLSQSSHLIRLTKPFTAEQLAKALAAATEKPSTSSQDAASNTAGKIRVLVVDDSDSARGHIRRVLNSAGLDCIVEAKDGEHAVALMKKESFELIVTDYNMPRLDGRGLIEFIRRHSSMPSVPVILVTTETDPAKLEAVRNLGVSAICEKSFPLEVIRKILQRRGEGHV
jgi:serine/threonine protein kinase